MSFPVRTSCPGAGNKNYIRVANGGWNTCILGKPTNPNCNVLANCVGYASGRFNEIINWARGTSGCTYTNLNCNAENFIEKAKADGLQIGTTPRRGAIGCAMGGKTLDGKDGAGHVWVVETVYDNNHTYTSESGYNNKYFWNSERYNNNGRWGLSSGFTFRGFIYLPADVQKKVDEEPIPPTPTHKFNIGDDVILNGPIYVSSDASKPANTIRNRKTKVTRIAVGARHPYNTTGDLGWCDESSLTAYSPSEKYPFKGIVKKGSPLYNADGDKYPSNAKYNRTVTVLGELNGRYKVDGKTFDPHIVYVDKYNVIKA